MFKKRGIGPLAQAMFVASLLAGVGLAGTQSSYADGCGTYCKARQARGICHEIVKTRGLKGHQRDVEFEKCRVDVMNSKQIEQLADDAETTIK